MSKPATSVTSLWDSPYAILVAAAAMWGANTLFSRLAVNEVSPMLLTLFRWLAVCAVMWPISARELPKYWPLLKPQIIKISIMGILGFTGFNACIYAAAYHTTAVNISIIQGSLPIMVMLGAVILYNVRIGWQQIIGILITLSGVAIIALRGDLQTLLNMDLNIGDLYMLLASLFYAIFTLGLRDKPKVPGLLFFAILSTAALIASLPLVAYEYLNGTFIWPSPKGWAVSAAIIIFPSCLAQIFFIRGVEIIGPARAALFINLIPVFGTAFAIGFLREPFTIIQGLGLLMVLIGIWLSERKS
ncbi:DMT family transporter [Microvirga sp. W0021]|uniref:DMT family transporter n=1 Tax=Hohaiivirga grylli TaxID=3133970 RepID=A0ABV0BKC3_9HYPH